MTRAEAVETPEDITRAELLKEAWGSDGNLEYKIMSYQQPVYDALWAAIGNPDVSKYVLNIARRFGKTHVASIVAIEFALRFPGAVINYVAPTDKDMRKILRGIYPVILGDAPKGMGPKKVNGTYEFPNGSIIYTSGANSGNADNIRGNKSDLTIVDEAGQISGLDYVIRSVLLPLQLTTDGTMLILSTPATEVDHDYSDIYREAKEEKCLSEFTVYDNKWLMDQPKKFAKCVSDAGGLESTTWKREYLVQFVTDSNKIIIPEWEVVREECLKPSNTNRFLKYYRKYVGMDIGFKDNTCLIFGYADFQRQKFVVQRSVKLSGTDVHSEAIGDIVKRIELELWFKPGQEWRQLPEVTRIADNNNPIFLNDIHRHSRVLFHGTNKDELHAMMGQTRLFIQGKKLEIVSDVLPDGEEACKYMVGCLDFGVWDKDRKAFAQSKTYGHYDGLAALVYVLRYVDLLTNPIPVGLDLKQEDLLFPVMEKPMSQNAKGMRNWGQTTQRRRGAN